MSGTVPNSFDIPADQREFIRATLTEDMGHGDLTSMLLIPRDFECTARIIAKEACTVAGMPYAFEAFRLLDPDVRLEALVAEGAQARKGQDIAVIKGLARGVLSAERTALNILQRLSGIATITRRFTEKIEDLPVKVLDTRKTTPLMRAMEKYAVRAGGGNNHRFGLYDGILIKDNHIRAAGGIKNALNRARGAHPFLRVEVEVESLDEVREALDSGAGIIMLDNMDIPTMREAVRMVAGRAQLEASGNVNLDNIRAIAETGVDFISIGALTHSAPAADLSLKIVETP